MTKILPLIFATLLPTMAVAKSNCPTYTPEQEHILDLAYSIGSQPDLEIYQAIGTPHVGNTLAAIVAKESFVANHIIRWLSSDGDYGSYGVGMVQLSTAFYMDDIADTWRNRDRYAPTYISRLMTDDQFAITYSFRYLKRMILQNNDLWLAVKSYNGSGPSADQYMSDVRETVMTFISCGKFDE